MCEEFDELTEEEIAKMCFPDDSQDQQKDDDDVVVVGEMPEEK
ncbi:MAG: hypothetical protein Salg2KO_23330 [Salibacteraceae bacterium]